MGIGYNAAVTVFGGTAPLVATAMTSTSGLTGYAWILFLFCMVSLSVELIATYFRKNGSLDTASNEQRFNHSQINTMTDEIERDISKVELCGPENH